MSQIVSFNMDRRVSSLTTLLRSIQSNQPDIIHLQDVPSARSFELDFYLHLFFDKQEYKVECHKSLAQIVNIKKVETKLLEYHNIEDAIHLSVRKAIILNARVFVINLYIRPLATASQLDLAIRKLEFIVASGWSRSVIIGDFNAGAISWDSGGINFITKKKGYTRYEHIKRNRGKRIEKFMRDHRLICFNKPDEPTFVQQNSRPCTIDLALIGEKLVDRRPILKLFKINPCFGHLALNLSVGSLTSSQTQSEDRFKRRLNFRGINSDHFFEVNYVNQKIGTNWHQVSKLLIARRMDLLAKKLYSSLLNVQKCITQTVKLSVGKEDSTGSIKIRKTLCHLGRAEDTLRKVRHQNATIRLFKRRVARRKVKKLRTKLVRLISRSKVNLSLDIWRRVAQFKQTNLPDTSSIDQSSIKSLAELEDIAAIRFPRVDPQLTYEASIIRDFMQRGEGLKVTEAEVDSALYQLRKKKHTGPEGVRFDVFLASVPFIKPILTAICQMSFWTYTIPTICKETLGILIPKKEKGKFRVVHVGTPLSSLLEEIALHRFAYCLEKNNWLNPNQYGFTAGRGRHDLVARLIELVTKFNRDTGIGVSTTLVSLDIEGAFDNVDQGLLIHRLILSMVGIDSICIWLASFILGRNIQLSYNHWRLPSRRVCTGVPQGSPLGPILWNYVINTLDSNPYPLITSPTSSSTTHDVANLIHLLMYADDLLIVCNGSSEQLAQNYIANIVHRLSYFKLRVSPSKSKQMTITLGTRSPTPEPNLSIDGQLIPYVDSLCVLGMQIDQRLQLRRDDEQLNNQLAMEIRFLRKLNLWNVIKNSGEWRLMQNSYIHSHIIDNNFPLLAIDSRSRDWADSSIADCVRHYLGWPSNSSEKLTRLLLGTSSAEIMVEKRLIGRLKTEHHYAAANLISLLNTGECHEYPIADLSVPVYSVRRYRNPALDMKILDFDIESRSQELLTWNIIAKGKRAAIAIATMGSSFIASVVSVCNSTYATPYTNTLALIKWLLNPTEKTAFESITMSRGNSALSALANMQNRDHRIIELREELAHKKWSIYRTNVCETDRLERITHRKGKDLSQWLDEICRRPHMISSVDASDLKTRFIEYCKLDAKDTLMKNADQTTVTKSLCPNTSIWSDINPSWINPANALALTGLIQDQEGNLIIGKRGRFTSTYEYNCTCESSTFTSSSLRLPIRLASSESIAIHRMFSCKNYKSSQMATIWLINQFAGNAQDNTKVTQRDIDKILKNPTGAVRLINHLTRCVFKSLNCELDGYYFTGTADVNLPPTLTYGQQ